MQSTVVLHASEPLTKRAQCTSLGFPASTNCAVDVPGNHSHGLSTVMRSVAPPIIPAIFDSQSEARGIFNNFFDVFEHRALEVSPDYAFIAAQDMRSFSGLSLCWFVSLQPALRVRRWQAVARITDVTATLVRNVDLVKFDKGVVYKCNLCYRLYAAFVPCAVCICLLCDTCHRVKPRNVDYFENQTYVCKCQWEYSFAESYHLRTGQPSSPCVSK